MSAFFVFVKFLCTFVPSCAHNWGCLHPIASWVSVYFQVFVDMIRYDISPLEPEAHLFIVGITIAEPTPQEQYLRLPSWIAGSYLIRDFASCIQAEQAFLGDRPVPIEKVDKCTWRVSTVGRLEHEDLYVYYQVWAFDESVRGNYLDNCRGFFNPAATFMEVLGNTSSAPLVVGINAPDDDMHAAGTRWRVATGMKRAKGTKRFDWGLYEASDYAELCDCPVELSDFTDLSFKAHGVRHNLIITNDVANVNTEKLVSDLKHICQGHIAFFEPHSKKSPVSEYTFLLNVTANRYGGLEHRNSAALAIPWRCLPAQNATERTSDYVQLLGLFSHEYFHTWCVKRIRPAAFVHSDYSSETYSTLLWLFEGFTSYYDNLLLRRAGLIDVSQYADLLTKDCKSVLETHARHMQSLAEASFDAWIKFYRPSANTPNAHVSYYRQGALAAWVLDSVLRKKSRGKKSLDDVMRLLWEDYKKAQDAYGGIQAEDVSEIVLRATGIDLTDLISRLTETVFDIDYAALLKPLGVTLTESTLPIERRLLGISGTATDAGFVVKIVYEHETAQWVGISPGDTLIAIDGVRVCSNNLEQILSRYSEGDEMLIHAFRDDALLAWQLLLGAAKPVFSTVELKPTSLGKAWLGLKHTK